MEGQRAVGRLAVVILHEHWLGPNLDTLSLVAKRHGFASRLALLALGSQQLSNLGQKTRVIGAMRSSSRRPAVDTEFLLLTSTLPMTVHPGDPYKGSLNKHCLAASEYCTGLVSVDCVTLLMASPLGLGFSRQA